MLQHIEDTLNMLNLSADEDKTYLVIFHIKFLSFIILKNSFLAKYTKKKKVLQKSDKVEIYTGKDWT